MKINASTETSIVHTLTLTLTDEELEDLRAVVALDITIPAAVRRDTNDLRPARVDKLLTSLQDGLRSISKK